MCFGMAGWGEVDALSSIQYDVETRGRWRAGPWSWRAGRRRSGHPLCNGSGVSAPYISAAGDILHE
jgi:hypothetical protein